MEHTAAVVPEEQTSTGLPHRKLLIWAFLGSECMFFGTLIAMYMVYQGQSLVGPFPRDVLNIPVTSVSTFVLLSSSLAMVLAYASITRGDVKAFRLWVLVTALLGIIFLGFQAYEFYEFGHPVYENGELVREGLTPRTNLFGTTFFTLTGFHGAHVAVGVLWLLSIFAYSFRGDLTREGAIGVDMAALYWHFVDVVWIVIFTVIYLIGMSY